MIILNKVNSLEEIKKAIHDKEIYMLLISSEDCSVCQAVEIKLDELMMNYSSVIREYVKVNEVAEIAGEFLVFTVPTILLFIKGKEVHRESRFINFDKIDYLLSHYTNM